MMKNSSEMKAAMTPTNPSNISFLMASKVLVGICHAIAENKADSEEAMINAEMLVLKLLMSPGKIAGMTLMVNTKGMKNNNNASGILI